MFLESIYQGQPILVVSDHQRSHELVLGQVLSGERRDLFVNAFLRAGISEAELFFIALEVTPNAEALAELILKPEIKLIIPLGDKALTHITGLKSSQKWHCSVISAKAEYGGKLCMPLLHPEYIQKVYRDIAYIAFGGIRAKEILEGSFKIPERKFILAQDYKTARDYLLDVVVKAPELAIDLETGRGQINTQGFAISPTEAVAIRMSPELYTPEEHLRLWQISSNILESSIPKIAANAIYEILFYARYGIKVNHVIHDTQYAMKFLHPELDKGLDNAGRLYTPFPYWKDDNDEWGNVQDWTRHLTYNSCDTTATYMAYLNQKKALKHRKLDRLFYSYQMKMLPLAAEMCINGMNVDEEKLSLLRRDTMIKAEGHLEFIQRQTKELLGKEINPKSPTQVKAALKAMGIHIPVQKGKESTDKKALTKLSKKHPDNLLLPALMALSTTNKQLSSYINFDYCKETSKVHYTLDGNATETGRWASYTDPWGRGFNAQTLPKFVKPIFVATSGKIIMEIDLMQAESRYVAWDCAEKLLMEMLLEGRDIHKYVAARIFKKPESKVENNERQLGKKSGHAANYGVGPKTFAESCLTENNIYLTDNEARRIIDGYFEVFPGIRQRQFNIQKELRATKKLTTPIGRERIFYDRIGDSLFREAYAYAPQSTIPDITNHLLLYLKQCFGGDIDLICQVHDSLVLECGIGRETELAEAARDYSAWHPKIILRGGELVIPVSCEAGFSRGKMTPL